ncbi:hypothetical protein IAT40_005217 [Kwoniella sp. CBS 6097]
MFGNGGNSFGALAMGGEESAAGPSSQVVDGEELDVDWVQLIKTNHDVNVRVSDTVDLEGLPSECNLMVVSNIWGLLIVGSNQDIRIHRLSDFHHALETAAKDASAVSTPVQTIALTARPVWIRLAMNEEKLVVATDNGSGVHLFNLKDVLAGTTSPYHSHTSDIPTHLLDVIPNPSPSSNDRLSRYVTLLGAEGFVVADIEERRLLAPVAGPFTCASWSAKGKQIVLGNPAGKLVQHTPEGVVKAEIPPPPDLEAFYPTFVQWLENDLFFVSYAQTDSQPDDPIETYIIHRSKAEFTFTKFFDPLNTMGIPDRSGAYRHFAGLKAWGDRTKHLSFVVSGLASEIGVLHGNVSADKDVPKWEVLILEETARGILPAAKAGVRDDASVLGLALDLTSDKIIKQGIVGGIEQPDLPPQPRLLAYTQEGVLISFDVRYAEAGTYPGLVVPQDIATTIHSEQPSVPQKTAVPAVAPVSNEPAAAPTKPAPSAFGASSVAFGSSGFGSSGFGQTTPSKTTSAFGASASGQSATPAFGSSSKPAAFGATGFGQSSTPASSPVPASTTASVFGHTSKPSAFGGFGQQPSSGSAFGQSAFGQSSKPSAFGSSTTGAFRTTPTTTPSKPSAFGTSTTPSAFGAPSTPSSSFGQTAFGQSSKPVSTTPSAFGSTTISSAFGSSSTPTSSSMGFGGFGSGNKASATSTASAFGTSAFGQPSKSTDGQSATPAASPFGSGGSAFGSTSAFGGGSAFGSSSAFGQKPASSSSTEPKQSAFGGFGLKSDSEAKPAPIIATAESKATEGQSTTSAFGGFGQKPSSAAQQPSSFGGFGGKSTETAQASAFAGLGPKASPSPSTESPQSTLAGFGQSKTASSAPKSSTSDNKEDFGLGGFASALETSAAMPSVADSPPATPVLGVSRKPAGLEDSPPTSPVDKPVTPKPSSQPSTSSSFIKPATAFGGSSSFGAFGNPSSAKASAPAFGAGSTPSAFSSASPSSNPSAFGSSGFGKPSTIGPVAKPAFGGSAFGQSSLPTGGGFGQTSTPNGSAFGQTASPGGAKPFGSITGGFGAFGAKTENGDKKPAGFGGFASSGKSIFGGAADKDKKEKTSTNLFGADPQPASPAFSLAPEPSSAISASTAAGDESKVNDADKPNIAKPEEEEEIKGFEVPEPAAQPENKTTTPPATPGKEPQVRPSTTPDQTPAKPETSVDTATPDAKPTAPVTSTPADTPVKGKSYASAAAEEPSAGSGKEDQAVDHGLAEVQEDPEPSEAIVKGKSDHDEQDEHDEYDEHDEDPEENNEYQGEHDEEHEDEEEVYEDEEEYEDEDDYEDEEDEEDYSPPGRRRSTSIPPDISPIKEEVSDELVSEQDGEEDDEERDEGQEEDDTQDGTEITANKSLIKSPPAWFSTKPLKSDAEEAGPTSPTPGSTGASLLARLSPAPTPELVSTPSATTDSVESTPASILAPTPTPPAPKLPPSFSFKHAARTSSPLAGPPANADSTTPESSPAKPAASSFSLFGNKPADIKSGDIGTPTPSNTGLFGAQPAESEPSEKATPATVPGGFASFGLQTAPAKATNEKSITSEGFSLFGSKPAEPVAKTGGFPGFGTAEATVKTPSAGGLSGFDIKSNDTTLSAGPPPLFGAAKTIPSAPAESSKSAFGLGLGRPGLTATTPSAFGTPPLTTTPAFDEKKPAFSFANINAALPKSTTSSASLTGSTAPSSAPSAAIPVTEAPSVPEDNKPTIPSKFIVPVREKAAIPPPVSSSGVRSMATVVEQIILTLQGDIQHLKTTLDASAKYHKAFSVPGFPHIDEGKLASHDSIPFSSISDLTAIVHSMSEELAQFRSADTESELKLAEVQSRMSKTDMKVSQAEKFLKARQDPAFAKVMQVQDLSPEQSASRSSIRKAVQVTESRLEELDSSINGLRRKAERHEQGRGASQQPALERVQRSVRNIDAAIRDRQRTIDDLARRIGGIRLGSPVQTGSGSPALSRTQTTPRRSTIPSSASVQASATISIEPTKDVLGQVENALNSDSAKVLDRLATIKVARLNRSTPSSKSAKGKGPVMIDALPMPDLLPPPTPKTAPTTKASTQASVPVSVSAVNPDTPSTPSSSALSLGGGGASASTPTPPAAPAPVAPSFGGIKFSLDPGNVSDLASSRSGNSLNRSGGAGSGSSHRTHAPAAKFVPSSTTSSNPAGNPVGGSDLFAFKKDDTSQGAGKKPASSPAGFFSLSGFGKK